MGKYDLEKAKELMNMALQLLTGHVPHIYVNDAIQELKKSLDEIEKDIEQIKSN